VLPPLSLRGSARGGTQVPGFSGHPSHGNQGISQVRRLLGIDMIPSGIAQSSLVAVVLFGVGGVLFGRGEPPPHGGPDFVEGALDGGDEAPDR